MKKKFVAVLLGASLVLGTVPPYTAVLADDDTESSFFNDFEEYDTQKEFVTVYEHQESFAREVHFEKAFSGSADTTRYRLRDGYDHPFYDADILTPLSGDKYPRPSGTFNKVSGSYKYRYIDKSKFTYGGLPGYIGINSNCSYPVFYGAGGVATEDETKDLTVVNSGGNNELILSPGMAIERNTNRSVYSMFGKENVELLGRVNEIKFKVRIEDDSYADGFRMSVVKNTGLAMIKSWQNYDYMTNSNQFYYNAGAAWYDGVTFMNGKVYLGSIGEKLSLVDTGAAVCDYEVGKDYDVRYYLNLEDRTNPRHMVCIYDADGNEIATKSEKLTLTAKTTTTLNNYDFYEGKVGDNRRSPAGNAYFSSFDEGSVYGVMLTEATSVDSNGNLGARAAVDDFGLNAYEPAKFDVETESDYYLKNPIPFIGAQSAQITMNYDILNADALSSVSVTASNGDSVPCTVSLRGGNTIYLEFADGLAAASNYYVHIPKELSSVFGNLDSDRVFTVRTRDNLSVDLCELEKNAGGNFSLRATVSNNSQSSQKFVVAAVVKKDGVIIDRQIHYCAANLEPAASKVVIVSGMTVPDGAAVESFYIDGFGSLHAFAAMNSNR